MNHTLKYNFSYGAGWSTQHKEIMAAADHTATHDWDNVYQLNNGFQFNITNPNHMLAFLAFEARFDEAGTIDDVKKLEPPGPTHTELAAVGNEASLALEDEHSAWQDQPGGSLSCIRERVLVRYTELIRESSPPPQHG